MKQELRARSRSALQLDSNSQEAYSSMLKTYRLASFQPSVFLSTEDWLSPQDCRWLPQPRWAFSSRHLPSSQRRSPAQNRLPQADCRSLRCPHCQLYHPPPQPDRASQAHSHLQHLRFFRLPLLHPQQRPLAEPLVETSSVQTMLNRRLERPARLIPIPPLQ